MAKTTLLARAYRWFIGSFGNLSISPTLVAKLAAVPSGDVIAFGDKVEPNLKVVGATLISGALGASTTLTVTVGGGAATGTVKLKLHYEVIGNL